jgi:hypothetical protein
MDIYINKKVPVTPDGVFGSAALAHGKGWVTSRGLP